MRRPQQGVHSGQLARRLPGLSRQRNPDKVVVLGPAGRVAAQPAARAGRAPLHARRALGALAQPASAPAVVATRWKLAFVQNRDATGLLNLFIIISC